MASNYHRWRNHYLKRGHSVAMSRNLAKIAYDAGYPPPRSVSEIPPVIERVDPEAPPEPNLEDQEKERLDQIEKEGLKAVRPRKFKGPEDPDNIRKTIFDPDGMLRIPSQRSYKLRREDRAKGPTLTGTEVKRHVNPYIRDCYEIPVGHRRKITVERKSQPPLTILVERIN